MHHFTLFSSYNISSVFFLNGEYYCIKIKIKNSINTPQDCRVIVCTIPHYCVHSMLCMLEKEYCMCEKFGRMSAIEYRIYRFVIVHVIWLEIFEKKNVKNSVPTASIKVFVDLYYYTAFLVQYREILYFADTLLLSLAAEIILLLMAFSFSLLLLNGLINCR